MHYHTVANVVSLYMYVLTSPPLETCSFLQIKSNSPCVEAICYVVYLLCCLFAMLSICYVVYLLCCLYILEMLRFSSSSVSFFLVRPEQFPTVGTAEFCCHVGCYVGFTGGFV